MSRHPLLARCRHWCVFLLGIVLQVAAPSAVRAQVISFTQAPSGTYGAQTMVVRVDFAGDSSRYRPCEPDPMLFYDPSCVPVLYNTKPNPATLVVRLNGAIVTASFTTVTDASTCSVGAQPDEYDCFYQYHATATLPVLLGTDSLFVSVSGPQITDSASARFTGVAATVTVSQPGTTLSLVPSQPGSSVFTIQNTSANPTVLTTATTCSGTALSGGCTANPASLAIASQGTGTVTVSMQASAAGGTGTVSLSVADSRAPGTITGSATRAVLTPAPAQVSATGPSTHSTRVGVSDSVTFTATNTGGMTAPVAFIPTCATGWTQCVVSGAPPTSLAPGASTTLVVRYAAPASEQTGSVALHMRNTGSGTDYSVFTSVLSAELLEVDIEALTDDAVAPKMSQGGSEPVRVSLLKGGRTNLVFTATCTGAGLVASSCAVSPAAVTLTTGQETTIQLTMTGTAAGGAGNAKVTAAEASAPTVPLAIAEDNFIVSAPRPAVVDVATFHGGTTIERGLCPTVAVVAEVASQCGTLRVAHGLPGVTTYGKTHAPTLAYYADEVLNPQLRTVITLNDEVAPDSVQINTYQVMADGSTGPRMAQNLYGALGWAASNALRFNTGLVGGSYATGLYTFLVETRFKRGGVWQTVGTSQRGTVATVQRSGSPFGNGWWMLGLEELYPQTSTTVLWVGGDGSTRLYTSKVTRGDTTVFVAPRVTHVDSLYRSNTSGAWRRALPGHVSVYFDAAGRHVKTKDRDTLSTLFAYDATAGRGRLASIIMPGGLKDTVLYSASGVTFTAPGGRSTVLSFESQPNAVTKITDPDQSTVKFGYYYWAPSLAISDITDRRSVKTSLVWGAYSPTFTSAWTPASPTQTVTLGFVTQRGRDADQEHEQASPATDPDYVFTGPRTDVPVVTKIWVDSLGATRQVTDAAGHTTTITHDATFPGLVGRIQTPDGEVSTASYDARGNVYRTRAPAANADGNTAYTTYTWNQTWDDLTTVVSPSGQTTTIGLEAATGNRLWEQTGPDTLRRVHYGYNGNQQVTSVTERGIPASTMGYDGMGNLAWTRTPIGFYTLYDHDALGRVTSVISPIDSAAARDTVQLRLHGSRAYSHYNVTGLVDSTNTSATDTSGVVAQVVTRSYFNPAGALDSLMRTGLPDSTSIGRITTRWSYDGLGRTIAETAPDGAVDRFAFTLTGTDTVVTRRGDVITTVYDTLGRATSRGTATSRSTFSYDEMGNMVEADNANAEVTRDYFPGGQLRSETQRIRNLATGDFTSHSYTVGYAYDLDGRRTGLSYPEILKGGTSRTHYAPFGAVDTVTTSDGMAFTYVYDVAGRMDTVKYAWPSEVTDERYFDDDGRLTHRVQQSPNYINGGPANTQHLIHDDYFRYDARGSKITAATLTDTIQNSYDGLGRLTVSATRTVYPTLQYGYDREKFWYDGLGNRFAHDYLPQGGALSSAGTEVYEDSVGRHVATDHPGTGGLLSDSLRYDPSGNLVTQGLSKVPKDNNGDSQEIRDSTTYLYDWEHHLVAHERRIVTQGTVPLPPMEGPERDTTAYDALGRRVRTRAIIGDGICSPFCKGESSIVRYIWDGSQLLGELRARGDLDATASEMEDDAATQVDTIGTRCVNLTLCDFPTDTTYSWSPYLGRVQYTHGIEGPDRPLRVLRMDFGGHDYPPVDVMIFPHENWRGLVDEVTDASGRAGLAASDAHLPVDLPATNVLAYYNTAGSRGGPRSWTGSLLAQQQDASGLMYMRNRFYNPELGKFTQEDPIGLAGGLNVYGFAGGDPVNYADPFGTCKIQVGYKGAGGVGRHAFIVVTQPDATKTSYVFRGGPSENGPSASGTGSSNASSEGSSSGSSGAGSSSTSGSGKGAGDVYAQQWEKGGAKDTDSPNGNHWDAPLVDDDEACDDYITSFSTTKDAINRLHIPYNFLRRNSNSTVNTMLVRAGLPGLPRSKRAVAGDGVLVP